MLIDLHCHTFPLSPCSVLEPKDLVKRAKDLGLDGICLTEHDEVWPEDKIAQLNRQYDFLVLRGMEVSTNYGHVLVYGLDRHLKEMWHIKQLRQIVSDAGGVMVLAHPHRSRLDPFVSGELPVEFDAFETFNGVVSPWSNKAAAKAAATLGLKGTGGSDSHAFSEIGLCATVFDEDIKNETDLITALRGGNFQANRLR